MPQSADIPIIVVSCDKYNDVWTPFFTLFFKNWSDCPHPLHLVSNFKTYSDNRVIPIKIGDDTDYSSNLLHALESIPQEWLIFWIDDRPPITPVKTDKLNEIIQLAQERNAGYVRLITCNPPSYVKGREVIGELPIGTRYRVSMTVALWKKETLLKILKKGETAWEIEKNGGIERSNLINDKFYALSIEINNQLPIESTHLISKGKLIWNGVDVLKREGLIDHLHGREKVTFFKNMYIEMYDIFWNSYFNVMWKIRKLKSLWS